MKIYINIYQVKIFYKQIFRYKKYYLLCNLLRKNWIHLNKYLNLKIIEVLIISII